MADQAAIEKEFREFLGKYASQLKASSVPEGLWDHVFLKLRQQVFDGGHVFQRYHHVGNRNAKIRLVNETLLPASDLFIFPHVFTSSLKDMASQLKSDANLVERLANILDIDPQNLQENAPEFDEQHASMIPMVMEQAGVDESTARALLVKNNYELLLAIMSAGEEPESMEEQALKNKIMGNVAAQRGDIPDDDDPLKWDCEIYKVDQTSPQVMEVRVPVPKGAKSKDVVVAFSPAHVKVGLKGAPLLIDSPLPHRIDPEESTWTLEKSEVVVLSIQKEEDKVWKEFIKGEKRAQKKKADPKLVEAVLAEIWKHSQLYQVQTGGSPRAVWYVSDELASAIWHSETPNVMTCPFLHLNEKGELVSYTLMWPIKEIHAGEVITRNYIPAGLTSDKINAYLCAWEEDDKELKKTFLASLGKQEAPHPRKLDLSALKISETPTLSGNPRVVTDIDHIRGQISKKAEVSSQSEANIIWTSSARAIQSLDTLREDQRIFYCPSRSLFSSAGMTSLFVNSHVAQRKILPTFTLPIQLSQFVEEYYFREKNKASNHWLIHPDATIHTNNLAQLIRQVDHMKTLSCSLYPVDPCLVNSRSFCLTLPFVITRFSPLQLQVGSDVNVHIADVAFKANSVFNHPDQFVQNSRVLAASETQDFVAQFSKQHPDSSWAAIVSAIQQTIKEVLISLVPVALEKAPQEEVVKSGNFFYAMSAEILLDSEFKPFLRTFHDLYDDLAPQETEEILMILSGVKREKPVFKDV